MTQQPWPARAATRGRDTEGKTWSSLDACKNTPAPQVCGTTSNTDSEMHSGPNLSQKIMFSGIWAGYTPKAFTARQSGCSQECSSTWGWGEAKPSRGERRCFHPRREAPTATWVDMVLGRIGTVCVLFNCFHFQNEAQVSFQQPRQAHIRQKGIPSCGVKGQGCRGEGEP